MHNGEGQLAEIILGSNGTAGRIVCPPELVPEPGQYLLVHDGADLPLPVPVFMGGASPRGFLAAPPLPPEWTPGTRLDLRGPYGRGFSIPLSARHIALTAFDATPARLLPLIPPVLGQGAEITLLCEAANQDLPEEVEVQPLNVMSEVIPWADYFAMEVPREKVSDMRASLEQAGWVKLRLKAQVLISTPMPCGGVAECGVCAVRVKDDWKMACKDGPVFDLKDIPFS